MTSGGKLGRGEVERIGGKEARSPPVSTGVSSKGCLDDVLVPSILSFYKKMQVGGREEMRLTSKNVRMVSMDTV